MDAVNCIAVGQCIGEIVRISGLRAGGRVVVVCLVSADLGDLSEAKESLGSSPGEYSAMYE